MISKEPLLRMIFGAFALTSATVFSATYQDDDVTLPGLRTLKKYTFGGVAIFQREDSASDPGPRGSESSALDASSGRNAFATTSRAAEVSPDESIPLRERLRATQVALRGDYSSSPRALAAAKIAASLLQRSPATNFEVTVSGDSPDANLTDNIFFPQTLRAAVQNADKTSAIDNITFAVASLSLFSPVTASQPVNIDGTLSGGGKVLIDPNFASPGGIWLSGGGHVVKNLKFTRVGSSSALALLANSGVPSLVQGCEFYNCNGSAINLNNSSNNVIGGPLPGDGNVIYSLTGSATGALAMILTSNGNQVIGNYIGSPDGVAQAGNSRNGILDEGSFNYIAHNVISGNAYGGISRDDNFNGVTDDSAKGELVEYNMIGVALDGLTAMGNGAGQQGSGYASIGMVANDTIRHNLVSANGRNGIECQSINSLIEFNVCGMDINMTHALGNAYSGVAATRPMIIQNNWISGNTSGVSLQGAATLRANVIGADDPAKTSIGNQFAGVSVSGNGAIIGGATPGDRNIISGNGSDGVQISGVTLKSVVVQNNYVGVDESGNSTIPNGGIGINIVNGADSSRVLSNIVCGNLGHGISVTGLVIGANTYWSEGNLIYMNRIGVGADGNTKIPNGRNGINAAVVRGCDFGTPDSGNTICLLSDSSGIVVRISSAIKIRNNFVGTNIPNTQVLGCGRNGIVLERSHQAQIGGDFGGSGNIIAGYDSTGISIDSCTEIGIYGNWIGNYSGATQSNDMQLYGIKLKRASNNVIGNGQPDSVNIIGKNDSAGVVIIDTLSINNWIGGNFIGVDGDSTTGLPNGVGILIDNGRKNKIGAAIGKGNLISKNFRQGVWVRGQFAIGNTIRFNQVFGNGALDIDLGAAGVTANDLGDLVTGLDIDTGPNNLLNFPAGISYTPDDFDTATYISGFLDTSNPEQDTVDIYAVSAVNDSSYGGGQIYLGSVVPDDTGLFVLALQQSYSALPYIFVSATATDTSGSTSEFSYVCGDPNAFGTIDNDQDGYCDSWEISGIDYDGDHQVDLPLNEAPYFANHRIKDIYVEVDWMEENGFSVKPSLLTGVEVAFKQAPVDNPNSSLDGIELHSLMSDSLPVADFLKFRSMPAAVSNFVEFRHLKWGDPYDPCGDGFGSGHFGDKLDRESANCAAILGAKRLIFRYCIFGVGQADEPGSSGRAEVLGNDFMVTVGDWSDSAVFVAGGQPRPKSGTLMYDLNLASARTELNESTFMHELGHTLGLKHGGADHINYKPHYLSVMNYSYQSKSIVLGRKLDYSHSDLGTLDENNLSETQRIFGPPGYKIVYRQFGSPSPADDRISLVPANYTVVDWDGLDSDGDGNSANDQSVSTDINAVDGFDRTTWGLQTLTGHEDWVHLKYDLRSVMNSPYLKKLDEDTITEFSSSLATKLAAESDYDNDGFSNLVDNCPGTFNPDQADSNHNGVGDICESLFPCGDANASGQTNITDAVYMVNYIFAGGPAPKDEAAGDFNCSNQTNITDVVYLVNYIFAGGAAPCAACP